MAELQIIASNTNGIQYNLKKNWAFYQHRKAKCPMHRIKNLSIHQWAEDVGYKIYMNSNKTCDLNTKSYYQGTAIMVKTATIKNVISHTENRLPDRWYLITLTGHVINTVTDHTLCPVVELKQDFPRYNNDVIQSTHRQSTITYYHAKHLLC